MNLTPLQPEFPQDRDLHSISPAAPCHYYTLRVWDAICIEGQWESDWQTEPPTPPSRAQVGVQESAEEKQGSHAGNRLSSPALC